MNYLFKNGTVATESGPINASLKVCDEKISELGLDLNENDCHVVDCTGLILFPGGVDVHTHMDLKVGTNRAVDDFYSGTVAAAFGGTTTIVDHIAFGPKGCAPSVPIHEYHSLAKDKAVIDYGFHGVLQDADDDHLNELAELKEQGISSFKIYLTYDGRLDDEKAFKVLQKAHELDLVIPVHCENHGSLTLLRQQFIEQGLTSPLYHALSRPNECEAEAVHRYLTLARMANDAPAYIVHLSTRQGLEKIRLARREGQTNIVAETCPQYLCLDQSRYQQPDGLKFVMSPPLRQKEDCQALWEGLADGSIQTVATDHCPFHYAQKKELGEHDFTKCPNGAPGVEERFTLIYSEGVHKGRLSLERFVSVISANPARAFGLYPQKGALTPGSDADIVLFDPNVTHKLTHSALHSKCDYSAYEGFEVTGKVLQVMSRGRWVVRDDQMMANPGDGKFLRRSTHVELH